MKQRPGQPSATSAEFTLQLVGSQLDGVFQRISSLKSPSSLRERTALKVTTQGSFKTSH